MSLIQTNSRGIIAVVLGTLVCEALLYGPSLCARRILAPTDLLVFAGLLGNDPHGVAKSPENTLLLDPVEIIYPGMTFAAREWRAGRLPLWNPYTYCGSPFLASHPSAVFQPFALPFYIWPDPRTFVWMHLLKTLVASLGAFLFLRKIGVSHWGSVVGGLCFAHAGYFVAWLSFPLSACAPWLPWGFLAIESIVARPRGWGGPALAAITAVLLVSGHLETAAQLLVAIAFYGAWRWFALLRSSGWSGGARPAMVVGIAAVLIGFGIGAIQLLPTAEYLRSSLRMLQRKEGWLIEDVPCDRKAELVRLCFPYLLGTWQRDSHALVPTTFNESSVNGYVGFTLLILLAPLGVVHRWRESSTWVWVVLGLIAAAPMFRIPLLELWGHLPPFDLMRSNRMLIITGWAVLVLGVRGLDSLWERGCIQMWCGALVGLVAVICVIAFLYVLFQQPPQVLTLVTHRAWPWFRGHLIEYAWITSLGVLGVGLWLLIPGFGRAARVFLGLLAVAELVGAEHGYNPQVDPATYYPERESIRYIMDRVGDGRVCGQAVTLTPNTGLMYGLRDVRGYDSVDPLPYLELLRVANHDWRPRPTYAVTRSFWSGPSPVLDMLSVRYFIAAKPLETTWERAYEAEGLWVYRSQSALPRVYIPRRALVVEQREERLRMLGDPAFDPSDMVLITEPCEVPKAPAHGIAELVEEIPCELRIRVHAETDSIVVLADSWAPGWSVRVDGAITQPLQANHALRAVRVPAGDHMVEWSYFPAAVRRGLWISGMVLLATIGWCLVPRKSPHAQGAYTNPKR